MKSIPTYKPIENITVVRINVAILVVTPFLGSFLAIRLLWQFAVNWSDLVLLAALYAAIMPGVTISYHRMLTHRSFRPHHPLTLWHWVRRLEDHADEARSLTSDVAYRIWRLYMAAFAHGFEIDRVTIYQTLLAKPNRGESGLPLTRADWYA